jgi:phospholipid/cholesterol/gamma-HCH transport system permease protein
MEANPDKPELQCRITAADTLEVGMRGAWTMAAALPDVETLRRQIDATSPPHRLIFETSRLSDWDSRFLTYIQEIKCQCRPHGITVDDSGLPQGVRRLLALADAVPERQGARRRAGRTGWLLRAGQATVAYLQMSVEVMRFVGEIAQGCVRLVTGRARFPQRDFGVLLQDCGSSALPIVSLISVLVGLILAFVGAVQLKLFGAQIYVANLVGLGMAREMGAMMAAVIMAGRTGAAFAAQLGTMQVNEEIDALVTMGISPIDYLVLPRIMALVLMMPLLCLYADLMGIAGGFIVGTTLLDLPFTQYLVQTREAVALNHFMVGLVKSVIFGIIVAVAGCHRGMQCGRSADAVGTAATRAVVTAIVHIVVADAIITVICDVIGV